VNVEAVAPLLDRAPLHRELVRRGGLRKFVELAWPHVEAVPFVGGWHIDEICAHLEAVSRGEIRRLVINVPPGMSKSTLVSVLWPAWDWVVRPDRRWMFASFDADLSRRDALKCRELVCSEWYQSTWGLASSVANPIAVYDGAEKQRTMGVYHTTARGFRFSTSTGGKATGWHAHIQVVDDPHKPADIQHADPASATNALEADWDWWRGTMASRKADPRDFSRVVIMQRLHENDLTAKCLKEGGWVHLRLPMRYEAKNPCVTPIGGDRRTEDGELLCPDRFDEEAVSTTEREMGSMIAAAQLQQRPSPAKGAIFDREWLAHEWRELPHDARLVQSWDCAFKDLSSSDYVVGQVWAVVGSRFFLVDQVRDRMSLPATCQAIKDLSRKWPTAIAKFVEDKANGPAVEQVLRRDVAGLVMVSPSGGKVARANAVSPLFEAGNVFVPPADRAPWIGEWREEMAGFPRAANDDQVDATTQALLQLYAPPDDETDTTVIATPAAPSRRSRDY
jgi:predicted phage terminase large subunit-like protein